jgi:hypothetical protein
MPSRNYGYSVVQTDVSFDLTQCHGKLRHGLTVAV